MQLYQRVEEILKQKNLNVTALAKSLGIPQPTLSRRFNDKNQEKLWKDLPKILELFNDISADWLYFEKGEMFSTATNSSIPPINKENDFNLLMEQVEELKKTNDLLKNIADYEKTEKLRLEDKISQLTQENARLKYQLDEQEIINKKVS